MARVLAGRGIIFIDPLDARLHRLAAPVFHRALDEADTLRDELLARSNELDRSGFPHVTGKGHSRDDTAVLLTWMAGASRFQKAKRQFRSGQIHIYVGGIARRAGLKEKCRNLLRPTHCFGPWCRTRFCRPRPTSAGLPRSHTWRRRKSPTQKYSGACLRFSTARASRLSSLRLRDFSLNTDSTVLRHARQPRKSSARRWREKSLPRGSLRSSSEEGEAALRQLLRGYEGPLQQLDQTLLGSVEIERTQDGPPIPEAEREGRPGGKFLERAC